MRTIGDITWEFQTMEDFWWLFSEEQQKARPKLFGNWGEYWIELGFEGYGGDEFYKHHVFQGRPLKKHIKTAIRLFWEENYSAFEPESPQNILVYISSYFNAYTKKTDFKAATMYGDGVSMKVCTATKVYQEM